VGWRYDPVFITKQYTLERHISDFENMAAELSGYTKTCVISFIDMYKKVKRNFPEAREVKPYERIEIGKKFVSIGKKYGITIKSCAEGKDLEPYGVDCGGCMTVSTFETALKAKLNVPKRKSPRSECACLLGNDIGNYDTCGHLCRYCYANANAGLVKENMLKHNPKSPFLLGGAMNGDKVHEARQESWVERQLSFF
jgi:DNA repair photolyase